MRVGSFSVLIPQGRERDSGHVCLNHGQVYTIKVGSHHPRRCDAEILVDGKSVGIFRLEAYGVMTLERPSHDTGCFTFFKADSTEGHSVGGDVPVDMRGLVQVVFRVERRRVEEKTSGGILRGMSPVIGVQNFSRMAPGVTGLTGQSCQQFVPVQGLEYDPAEETRISLRLVAGQNDPRPLTPRANPIPAAL